MSMPSDSERIVIDHVIMPDEYKGVPTFALRSGGGRRPLLMNRLGGRGEMSEEELVRNLGNYTTQGYVYNPNGLTYGDMNALLNETGNWFDDWDGYFALYMWDATGEGYNRTPSMELIFKHDDDEGLYEEVIMDGRDLRSGRMEGFGKSQYRPASRRVLERAGVQMASESLTKEASVGMIIGQGDPSSPPSGIFMAEDPTRAEASDLGGPTEPGNAGVPADVGGDDLVPYDSPSSPPAGIFMNAESKVYESKPFKNVMLGIAFTISALTFWSTAGTAVKNYVVSVVDTYAPKLLEPQNKIIITTLALVGIVYFGSRLRSENQPLTIPRMIDLAIPSTEASVTDV